MERTRIVPSRFALTVSLAAVAALGVAKISACGGCVAAGTLVLTPDGEVAVERLRVGDLVLSYDPDGARARPAPVVRITSSLGWCHTIAVGDRELSLTEDHPIYDPARDQFAPAREWLDGARNVLSTHSSGMHGQSLSQPGGGVGFPCYAYDLTVASGWRTFVAETVVVHNKSGPDCHAYKMAYDTCFESGGDTLMTACEAESTVGACFRAKYYACFADNECSDHYDTDTHNKIRDCVAANASCE